MGNLAYDIPTLSFRDATTREICLTRRAETAAETYSEYELKWTYVDAKQNRKIERRFHGASVEPGMS
jgi:hypothetical protein